MAKIPPMGCLIPMNSFLVGERHLYLYSHPGHTTCANYSLYWEGEAHIQHACTDREVFNIL